MNADEVARLVLDEQTRAVDDLRVADVIRLQGGAQ